MSSETYHEALELLSEPTKDMHRAITSLMEELEAVDWYQQRSEATTDPELRAVLEHNRDEETEHAMMLLEWLRRQRPTFAKNIGIYLGKAGPITGLEAAAEGKPSAAPSEHASGDGSLGVGSLKGT